MATPAQSITVHENERVPLTLTTSDTFTGLQVRLQIGVETSPASVALLKSVDFSVDGNTAQAVLAADIPAKKYVSQLVLFNGSDILNIITGPQIVVMPAMIPWEP